MLAGLSYRVRSRIAARPALYFPMYRMLRSRRHGLLSPTTALTLEGFPRSGNSFALRAFESVNPQVEVAHHTHAAAQVIASVRRGLPTLVLIRAPADAVKSLMVMRPRLPAAAVVESYLMFYRPLERWLPRLVLASFAEAGADFGAVTRQVNRRFGTDFAAFEHTAERVADVFARIESLEARSAAPVRMARIARPTGQREQLKALVSLDGCAAALAEAEALFARFLQTRSL